MAASVSLDELVALNDEMLALVRAGVPLEQGLRDVSHDAAGHLARISRLIAERMSRGETLPHILATSTDQFPRLYRAVVEAGIRSGQLTAALELTSATVRRMAALRRLVVISLAYPLFVFFACYAMLMFLLVKIAPVIFHSAPGDRRPVMAQTITHLNARIEWWGAILPAVVLTATFLWWYRSRSAIVLQTGGSVRVFGWIPPMRRLLDDGRAAGFAEMLSLLVEHDVPLNEAVKLAAEASGDARLISAATKLAERIAAGAVTGESRETGAIPPLLRWLIVVGDRERDLAKALRHAADTYRRSAIRRADWLRLRLPVVLLLVIGGTVTLIYALALFAPWTAVMYEWTKP